MKKIISKSILGLSLTLAMSSAFAKGGFIADGITQTTQPTINKTYATVQSVNTNMIGTNANTAASLAILQSNFRLDGGGFVNSNLEDIFKAVTAQSIAVKNLSDLQTENLFYLQGAMEMAAAERSVDMTNSDALIDLCVTSTSAARASAGRAETKAEKSAGASQKQLARATTTTNALAAATRSSKIHERDYCSTESNVLGFCDVVSETPNADINPASIKNGAVKMVPDGEPEIIRDEAGEIVAVNVNLKVKDGEPSVLLTHDEASRATSIQSMNNLINPLPDQSIDKSLKDSESYHDYKAAFNARQTRISQAYMMPLEMNADATPSIPLESWIAGLGDEGVNDLSDEYKESNDLGEDMLDKVTVDKKISLNHFRQLEVSRRYENSRWYEKIGSMDNNAREVEMMSMMALQLSLLNKQIQLLENLNMTTSTQLANDLTPLGKEELKQMEPVVR